MISYFFPPLGGPGVQRIQKFVRYLPQNGWNPIVLTVKNIKYVAYDYSLWDDIKNTEVHRTESADLMRILYRYEKTKKTPENNDVYKFTNSKIRDFVRNIFPIDPQIGWLPFAVKKGIEICRTQKIEVVYATLTPFSSVIVGYYIAKRCKKKLILDYRDLWQGKTATEYLTNWHKRFSIFWESKVLQFASKVIINTRTSEKIIKELYPDISQNKFTVLHNGFDKNDFKDVTSVSDNKKLIFTFTGGFYEERTPEYFLNALLQLKEENLIPDHVEFRFIGNYVREIEEMLSIKVLQKWIKIIPQVEHKKSIKYLLESDILLIFLASQNSHFVIPAKLFEYLAARKPIFAMISPQGESADIIKQNNIGEVCAPEDVASIKKIILKFIKYHQEKKLSEKYDLKKKDFSKYERSFQAKRLSEIIIETCASEKKKILHIQLLPLLSGAQNMMLNLLEGLDKDKYEIYVIAKPDGPLVQKVIDSGYHFIPVSSLRREISPFWDFIALFKIFWICKKYNFDIVHTHSSKTGFLGRIAARFAHIPKIYHTMHGFSFHDFQSIWLRIFYITLEKIGAKFCDKIIFVNNHDRITSSKLKIISSQKAQTIYNGIKLAQIKKSINCAKWNEKIVIGSIARFEDQKNMIKVVESAIKICQKSDIFQFIFIGDGEHLNECKNMIKVKNLTERIILPGWKNNVYDWLLKFDVFLLYSKWEGLPISILEAMSIGLPIIASNIKGNNELVDDENGGLIDINEPQKLVNTILELPQNCEKWQIKGKNSLQKVKDKFLMDNFRKEYVRIYDN